MPRICLVLETEEESGKRYINYHAGALKIKPNANFIFEEILRDIIILVINLSEIKISSANLINKYKLTFRHRSKKIIKYPKDNIVTFFEFINWREQFLR